MVTLQTLLFVLQVLVALALIGFILVQHGKGADAGAAFGSGASSTVFGSSGSGNFMTRTTTILALVFLLNSLVLAYIATHRAVENPSLIQRQQTSAVEEGPVRIPESEVDIPAVPGSSDTDSDIPTIPEE